MWRDSGEPARAAIETFLRRRYGWLRMMPIPPEDAEALESARSADFAAPSNERDLWNIRHEIVRLLDGADAASAGILRANAAGEPANGELRPHFATWRANLCEWTKLVERQEHRT